MSAQEQAFSRALYKITIEKNVLVEIKKEPICKFDHFKNGGMEFLIDVCFFIQNKGKYSVGITSIIFRPGKGVFRNYNELESVIHKALNFENMYVENDLKPHAVIRIPPTQNLKINAKVRYNYQTKSSHIPKEIDLILQIDLVFMFMFLGLKVPLNYGFRVQVVS